MYCFTPLFLFLSLVAQREKIISGNFILYEAMHIVHMYIDPHETVAIERNNLAVNSNYSAVST